MTNPRKEPCISQATQRAVCDVLIELIVSDVQVEPGFYDRIMNQYGLCHDPFTGFPCTFSEYFENKAEYDRQTMMEKYGHCDGLD